MGELTSLLALIWETWDLCWLQNETFTDSCTRELTSLLAPTTYETYDLWSLLPQKWETWDLCWLQNETFLGSYLKELTSLLASMWESWNLYWLSYETWDLHWLRYELTFYRILDSVKKSWFSSPSFRGSKMSTCILGKSLEKKYLYPQAPTKGQS